jgi:hypothetical protein
MILVKLWSTYKMTTSLGCNGWVVLAMVALYLLLVDAHWMIREWKHEGLSDVFGVSCFVDEIEVEVVRGSK